MSDEGDRTCPLCAEEMDLTDQQLKPCKCGYEICVWCWHHIMEMAEKEDVEGRCPACRTPYDKERIVGMAANCERMVAEINAERKNKSQKAKPKAPAEARKHLNGVRVVKRNLVYITGLPSNLADESILERKEYFGQYGKVLKVSISRTASTIGAQQASNNSTFSVYITYAREEEAIRCIQAVHNFILEGKPLRACFGTTKYCHTWLRNMTCSNPDCLYLHDVGSQEDSFTKDEIISAYTRGRVPQSASNNLQRCSGNVLPPPLDDWCSDGEISGKHVQKSASNNTAVIQVKGSSISNGGRSTVLPAAASWGSRVSNCRPPAAVSQNPVKQKAEMLNCSSSLSSIAASTKQTSAWHDEPITSKNPEGRNLTNHGSRPSESMKLGVADVSSETNLDAADTCGISAWNDGVTASNIHEGVHMEGRLRPVQPLRPGLGSDGLVSVLDFSTENILDDACPSAWDDDVVTTSHIPKGRDLRQSESLKPSINRDCQTSASDVSSADMNVSHTSGISIGCPSSHDASAPENKDGGIMVPRDNTNLVDILFPDGSDGRSSSFVPDKVSNGPTVSGNTENLCLGLPSATIQHQSSVSNRGSTGILRNLASNVQQYYPQQGVECLASTSSKNNPPNVDIHVSRGLSDWNSEAQVHILASRGNGMEDAFVTADPQRLDLSHVINESSSLASEHYPPSISNRSSDSFWSNDAGKTCFSPVNGVSRTLDIEVGKGLLSFRDNGPVVSNACKEDYLSSYATPGKVFEGPGMNNTEKEAKILGRFDDLPSFGRAASMDIGESSIVTDMLALDFDPWGDSLSPANNYAKMLGEKEKQDGSSKLSCSWKSQNSSQSRFSFARQENQANLLDASFRSTVDAHKLSSSAQEPYGDGFHNGLIGFEGSNGGLLNRSSLVSSDTTAGVSRAKVSAPPGFRVPNRAPPPGFSSHDRYDRAYETSLDNHLPGNPSILNQYQVHSAGNAGDVEFIDPAILAVGKGILPLRVNSSGLVSRSAFPSQFSPSDSDTRFLLKQQSISPHQGQRIPENIGYGYLPSNEAYIPPGLMAQNHSRQPQFAEMSHQQPRPSHVSTGQWDGWTGFDMGMGEILRNNRFGL